MKNELGESAAPPKPRRTLGEFRSNDLLYKTARAIHVSLLEVLELKTRTKAIARLADLKVEIDEYLRGSK